MRNLLLIICSLSILPRLQEALDGLFKRVSSDGVVEHPEQQLEFGAHRLLLHARDARVGVALAELIV